MKLCILVGLFAALPAAAQAMTCEFSPNPAVPGVGVMIWFWDALGQGGRFPARPPFTIHQGSSSGPQVEFLDPGSLYPTYEIVVSPFGGCGYSWNLRDWQGNAVPPGTYWFRKSTQVGSQQVVDQFCLHVQAANAPALLATGGASVGQTTPLQIRAPSEPLAAYLAAVSFSSNLPIRAFNLQTCLSPPVFLEALVNPIGSLDGAGNSTGLALRLPNVAAANHLGLLVQALLLGPGGLRLTNAQSFFVR